MPSPRRSTTLAPTDTCVKGLFTPEAHAFSPSIGHDLSCPLLLVLDMRQALAIPRQGSGVRLQRFLHYADIGAANHGWHLARCDEIFDDRCYDSVNQNNSQRSRGTSSCPKLRHRLDRHQGISWWNVMIEYQVYNISEVFATRMQRRNRGCIAARCNPDGVEALLSSCQRYLYRSIVATRRGENHHYILWLQLIFRQYKASSITIPFFESNTFLRAFMKHQTRIKQGTDGCQPAGAIKCFLRWQMGVP